MSSLICISCGEQYNVDDPRYQCRCGGLLDLQFQPSFPIDKIQRRKPTMWRYREAIPIASDEHIVSFDEGFTPLLEIPVAGRLVHIKQEQLFPTGSYKDRGASVLISHVNTLIHSLFNTLRIRNVVEDSSGNAGSAVAAYCARANIACDIYLPAGTSPGKSKQVEAYGATLHRIPGSREDTAAVVLDAARHHYYASHCWNPFFFHGTKTFAFEVCEQLAWQAPDIVVLPVGNGTLLLGAYIGFHEMHQSGIIKKIPRIIGIQAANCAPLAEAYKNNSKEIPMVKSEKTIAEGIAIAAPVRGKQIIDAVIATEGEFIAVSESDIKHALTAMGRNGFYIEPTSAATIAGLEKFILSNDCTGADCIVSVFTGHGLKAGK